MMTNLLASVVFYLTTNTVVQLDDFKFSDGFRERPFPSSKTVTTIVKQISVYTVKLPLSCSDVSLREEKVISTEERSYTLGWVPKGIVGFETNSLVIHELKISGMTNWLTTP